MGVWAFYLGAPDEQINNGLYPSQGESESDVFLDVSYLLVPQNLTELLQIMYMLCASQPQNVLIHVFGQTKPLLSRQPVVSGVLLGFLVYRANLEEDHPSQLSQLALLIPLTLLTLLVFQTLGIFFVRV